MKRVSVVGGEQEAVTLREESSVSERFGAERAGGGGRRAELALGEARGRGSASTVEVMQSA